jgi:hypothetical protein
VNNELKDMDFAIAHLKAALRQIGGFSQIVLKIVLPGWIKRDRLSAANPGYQPAFEKLSGGFTWLSKSAP